MTKYVYSGKKNKLTMKHERSGRVTFTVRNRDGNESDTKVSLDADEARALVSRLSGFVGGSVSNTSIAAAGQSSRFADEIAKLEASRATLIAERDKIQETREALGGLEADCDDAVESLDSAIESLSNSQ